MIGSNQILESTFFHSTPNRILLSKRSQHLIIVRGHYLLRDANRFAIAKLEENFELRGTDNVQGQVSEHIFAPNGGYCLHYPPIQIFFNKAAQLFFTRDADDLSNLTKYVYMENCVVVSLSLSPHGRTLACEKLERDRGRRENNKRRSRFIVSFPFRLLHADLRNLYELLIH